MVPYKEDTGSNKNILPLHIHKRLFPGVTKEQLVATKNKKNPIKNI